MKKKLNSKIIFLLLSTILFCIQPSPIECIDYEIKTDGFTFHNQSSKQWIEVPNRYRPDKSSAIKFLFGGAPVKNVEEINSTFWNIVLSDGQPKVTFSMKQHVDLNVTEYRFLWPGGGSNVNREVCFDYGYNNASW